MIVEARLADVVVLGLERLEIRLERRLRVDDDVLAAREPDDQVRATGAPVVTDRRLLREIAIREHARGLDDAPELHLSPAAAHDRRAEGGDEIARLLAELALGVRETAHLRQQRAICLGSGALQLLDLPVDLLEGFLDRADELLHSL